MIPTWLKERDEQLRAAGLSQISCVGVTDPQTGERLRRFYVGDINHLEHLLLVDPPPNFLRYGIGCVLVAATSRLLPATSKNAATHPTAPRLTVFAGRRPR